jgi:hypothetical protein
MAAMQTVREQIADLETEIESRAREAESCRRLIRGAKLALGCAAVLYIAGYLDLFVNPPAAYLAATALFLGGLVAWGSNRSTLQDAELAIAQAEATRDGMIDGLVLTDAPPLIPDRGSGW